MIKLPQNVSNISDFDFVTHHNGGGDKSSIPHPSTMAFKLGGGGVEVKGGVFEMGM